jgi:hypothetical protein
MYQIKRMNMIFTLQFSLVELEFLLNIDVFDYKGIKVLFEEIGMFNNMLCFEEEVISY